MKRRDIETDVFLLASGAIRLRVFTALPQGAGPFPSVQIHHAGGGYEPIYEEMAAELAGAHGIAGVAMIHRGYPGSGGQMEYGKGEIDDIAALTAELQRHPRLDSRCMGIMGYSRGAHNALLAVERCPAFRAGALWSTPVDMFDHVEVNPWIAEMFGGWPDEVPEEYRIRSSILFAERVSCPLLLLHGEADDVVPVRHTLRLARALEELGKPVTVRTFPGEGHIWSAAAFALNWRLTVAFFRSHFGAGQD
jgi:dipeptidyl aminopeptidase/acylaminoacyl peptidase